MTYEEALKIINKNLQVAIHDLEGLEPEYEQEQLATLRLSREALEKQIPKKPIYEIGKDYEGNFCNGIFKCSCCGRTICMEIEGNYNLNYPYCNCGQALDWSEEK